MFKVVLEYDLVLVRETGESVWVKDDRETKAIECVVMAANMMAWSRNCIGGCSVVYVGDDKHSASSLLCPTYRQLS